MKKTTFINVQHAEDYKAKMEKTKASLKIPTIVCMVASTLLIIIMKAVMSGLFYSSEFFATVISAIAMGLILVELVMFILALVKGGKMMLSLVGKMVFWGFVFVPLPYSIFVGFFALVLTLYAVAAVPWILFVAVWLYARKEAKRAEEYILYNSPQTVINQDPVC